MASEVRYDERIYLANAGALREIVSATEAQRDQILLVGHNPGLAEFLLALTGADEDMPTAALAKVSFPIQDWSELGAAKGALVWLVTPKELLGFGSRYY